MLVVSPRLSESPPFCLWFKSSEGHGLKGCLDTIAPELWSLMIITQQPHRSHKWEPFHGGSQGLCISMHDLCGLMGDDTMFATYPWYSMSTTQRPPVTWLLVTWFCETTLDLTWMHPGQERDTHGSAGVCGGRMFSGGRQLGSLLEH